MADKLLSYKGKPLVRKDKTIYFGDFSEEYYILIIINQSKTVGDVEVATKVSVQLHHHDPDDGSNDTIEKSSEKRGLYAAMDIADIWLTRALAE
ncbi:MAG: hypothetical protein K5761_08560 [Clostridiales bacterium]|nr:hypothetical protein [Clostridiales bacterium]